MAGRNEQAASYAAGPRYMTGRPGAFLVYVTGRRACLAGLSMQKTAVR